MRHFKSMALIALLSASGAPAMAVTFDLTGSGPTEPSKTFTQGGVSVTVTAQSFVDATNTIVANPFGAVTQNANGLGVQGSRFDRFPEITGPALGIFGELMTFTFSKPVRNLSAMFGEVDGDDDADVFVDGSILVEDIALSNGGTNMLAAPSDLVARSISFGADAALAIFGGGDDFRVTSISATVVPVPAAGLLLAGALGALGVARRRAA